MELSEFQNKLILKQNENTQQTSEPTSESDQDIQQILKYAYDLYKKGKLNNLRTLKTIVPQLNEQLKKDYNEFDEVNQVITASENELIKSINKYYLFYHNNKLFNDICKHMNSVTRQDSKDKEKSLYNKLNAYNLSLQLGDFKHESYKNWRDSSTILKPNISDFLFEEIEFRIKQYNDLEVDLKHIYGLMITYLDKFINQKTKNTYYITHLLMILFITKECSIPKLKGTSTKVSADKVLEIMYQDSGFSWVESFIISNLFTGELNNFITIFVLTNKVSNRDEINAYDKTKGTLLANFETYCFQKTAKIGLANGAFHILYEKWFKDCMYSGELYSLLRNELFIVTNMKINNMIEVVTLYCNLEIINYISDGKIKEYNNIFVNKLYQSGYITSNISIQEFITTYQLHQINENDRQLAQDILNETQEMFTSYCKHMQVKLNCVNWKEIFTKSSSNLSDEDVEKILYNLDITNELD